jgi:hypothetical protein
MRSTNELRVVAHVLAAGLVGCSAADEHTTLAELERAVVLVSLERDACSCSCGKLICWDFSCSGADCSIADEYQLIVQRDLDAGDGSCFEMDSRITARLFAEDAEAVDAEVTTHGCAELGFRWRGPSAGLPSRPHRIEISDASRTWSIDDPFALSSLAVLAPASAMSASGIPATVRAGDVLAFSLAPPARLTDAHASLRSSVTHDAIELRPSGIHEDELDVSVPVDTPPGLYDFQLGAGTLLAADACDGPALCRGRDVGMSFELRVE